MGRDAAYGYRHLLQLLTARRLAKGRIGLSHIKDYTQSMGTHELEKALNNPVPTSAQLLVNRFQDAARPKVGPIRRERSVATGPSDATSSVSRPLLTQSTDRGSARSEAPDPVSVLAQEVERLRIEVSREIRELLFVERKKATVMESELTARLDVFFKGNGAVPADFPKLVNEVERIRHELGRFNYEVIGRFSRLMDGQEQLRRQVDELRETVHKLLPEQEAIREAPSTSDAEPDEARVSITETDKKQGVSE